MNYKQTIAFLLTLSLVLMVGRFWPPSLKVSAITAPVQLISLPAEQPQLVVTGQFTVQSSVAVVDRNCALVPVSSADLLFGGGVDLWQLGDCASLTVVSTAPTPSIVSVGHARPLALDLAQSNRFEPPVTLKAEAIAIPAVIPLQIGLALLTITILLLNRSRVNLKFARGASYIHKLTQPQLMVFRC